MSIHTRRTGLAEPSILSLARVTLVNIETIARVDPVPGGTFVVTLKNNQ